MNKTRIHKAEMTLAKLRAKTEPSWLSCMIIMHGETEEERNADVKRQIAAAREKGYQGKFIVYPEQIVPPIAEP